jgi:hypothetical protein
MQPPVSDPDCLPQGPAERLLIASYPINDQDACDLVYLILRVATVSVEKTFLMMNFVTNRLRNIMNDGF